MREKNIMGIVKKLLLGVAVLGIACLAGSKEVRATDPPTETLSYTESSRTITWTTENVAKVKIGSEMKTVTTNSYAFTGTELRSLIPNPNEGLNLTSVGLYAEDGSTLLATGSFNVPGYAPKLDCTPSGHGSFTCNPVRGFLGETYSAEWVPNDEYYFSKWNDTSSPSPSRSGLVFGDTRYGVTVTKAVTVTKVNPTKLDGASATAQPVSVTISPALADPDYLYYTVTDIKTCSVNFTYNKDTLSFTVSGNGSFNLNVYYGIGDENNPVDSEYVTKQAMTVTSTVEDIVLDSHTIEKDETKYFTVSVIPEGSVIECLTTKAPSGVTDFDYAFPLGATEGTLTVTTSDKATGTLTFKFKAGNLTKDLKITVTGGGGEVESVTISGPEQLVYKEKGTYQAKINGKVSSQVVWEVDDPTLGTIDSKGVLTAKSKDGTIAITATAIADGTKYDTFYVEILDKIDLNYLVYKSDPDDTGTITLTKVDGGTGHKLDLNWKKGVTGDPENASVSSISYTLDSGDPKAVEIKNGVITPLKKDQSVSLQPKVKFNDGTIDDSYPTIDIDFIDDWATSVSEHNSSSSSSVSSDYYISFKYNNNEVYTGYDPAVNLTDITGYRIEVVKDGNVLASDTIKPSGWSVGESYKVGKEKLNTLLDSASSKLSGDSSEIQFRISPVGESQDGKTVVNTAAGKTITRTVYKNGSKYQLDKTSSSSSSSSSSMKGSGAGGSDLDKVPKTGEGNMRFLIIMIAIISACIAASILLSYMPAKNGGKAGDDKNKKE